MKKLILTVATAAMMFACTQKPAETNPFLSDWNTPDGVPPFDKIKVEHYLPAFEEGIKEQKAEIEAIVNNEEAPTFENTLVALDRSGKLLSDVSLVFFNLTETDGNEETTEVMNKVLPMVSEHNDNIYMDARLYERVKAVYDARESQNYTTEQNRLIEKVYNSFVRNGISLPAEKQARLREINSKLSQLQQKFGQNVLAETNSFKLILENEEDLAGLPESVRTAAAEAAKAQGLEGKWVFGLQKPSWIPFMQYSENRDLREKMYKAYTERCNHGNEYDNKEVVIEIIKLRIEKANLLGYETPAEFILDDTMAKTPKAVDPFLLDIFKAANNKAKEELKELQKLADKDGIKVEAWDWDYYTEKLRQQKYSMNEEETAPYFKMENVREHGIFAVANKLYGLNFEKLENMPVYHPEVECFKVTKADGSLLGIFYTDYFPRASKRVGAWMTNFCEQYYDEEGNDHRPVIVNVGNFTKPTANTPSLLTLDNIETMFHEFGHALHGLFASSNYKMLSGTNVSRDFVELPSQFNENWAFQPEVMRMYAKHYETGEVIPDELIEKILSVGTFNQGFVTTELCAASILDMNWHSLKSADGIDPIKFEKEMMDKIGLIPEIAPRYRTTYFNHIWTGGYSAGYYSYLWSEVLDKDAFSVFEEKGIFDQETANKFRTLLEGGNEEDPMVLYRNYRGADPTPDAMLRGRGLK